VRVNLAQQTAQLGVASLEIGDTLYVLDDLAITRTLVAASLSAIQG